MAVYSIICEYNPFHNGHAFQINSLKPNTVVCLMSGNVVQRGGFAVCDKYERARAALECGADLVLELPYPCSMLSAEYFASAGVKILDKLGFTDYLSFGCENENISVLEKIASYLVSEEFEMNINALIASGPELSFAKARENVIEKYLGEECANVLKSPNNILAVEYIKAIKRLNSRIIPKPILRTGAGYHDENMIDGFASATAIRSMIEESSNISEVVPANVCELYERLKHEGKLPSDEKKLDIAILSFLRKISVKELSQYYDCNSVAEKIKKASLTAKSAEQLYDTACCLNYTRTRIRRCVMAAFLGIKHSDAKAEPLYTTVLGLNPKGAELLSQIDENCGITVITKPAHIKKYDGTELYRRYMNEIIADDIYSLTFEDIAPSGESLRRSPVTVGF